MAAKCCIVGCPFKSAKIPLIPFPKTNASNHILWVAALQLDKCRANNNQFDNLFVCAMHFNDWNIRRTGKVCDKDYPLHCLSSYEIGLMIKSLNSINYPVAEWLHLTRSYNVDAVVNDEQLIAKAKKVVSILKLCDVDIDFGWIENFEEYALKNGIELWRKSTNVDPSNKTEDLMQFKSDELSKDLESIKSISTYKQALDMAELLEEYVERTKNGEAIQLIAHIQEVIAKDTAE